LSRWLDDAQLAVSELLTNGVVHARTPLTLGIYCDDEWLEVSVVDRSPLPIQQRPHRRDVAGDLVVVMQTERHLGQHLDERDVRLDVGDSGTLAGGRGLLLVEALADQWGVTPRGDGKTVWARFALVEASRTQPSAHVSVTGGPPTPHVTSEFPHDAGRTDMDGMTAAGWPETDEPDTALSRAVRGVERDRRARDRDDRAVERDDAADERDRRAEEREAVGDLQGALKDRTAAEADRTAAESDRHQADIDRIQATRDHDA
jgi:hypothetical protein